MNMEDLYRLLRAGHVQAQGIVDTVVDPLLVLDSSLCVQNASRSFYDTFKVDRFETIGEHLYQLGNGQWDIPELRRLLSEVIPKATAVIDYEVEQEFPNLGRKTMLITARTLHHPDNGSRSMLLSIVDVTERFRRNATQDMLFGELRHRMKNLLAVAQSIAKQTTTEGRSAQEYRDAFLGRFAALLDAHDLAYADLNETGLQQLFDRIMKPYTGRPEAYAIEPGPPVNLPPDTITALGLVLHELATNAAKYGALSVPGGHVQASWAVENANSDLRIRWIESGGPAVTQPSATGYGTRLIEFTTKNLGGQVAQDFAQDGLTVEIVLPLGKEALRD